MYRRSQRKRKPTALAMTSGKQPRAITRTITAPSTATRPTPSTAATRPTSSTATRPTSSTATRPTSSTATRPTTLTTMPPYQDPSTQNPFSTVVMPFTHPMPVAYPPSVFTTSANHIPVLSASNAAQVYFLLYYGHFQLTIGLICYDCPKIQHPRFCEYVKECSNDQVCGIERKVDINGAVVFNTGCMTRNTCQTSPSVVNGIKECYHCCSTDLCNSYGCGEQDTPIGNGTMCYNCLGALKGDGCRYVTFCDSSKMCYIEERTHFGEVFYNSGCKERHVCESQYQFNPIIGRRRSTTQFSCCGSQLCNNGGQVTGTTSLPDTSTRITTHSMTNTTQATCNARNCLHDGYCERGDSKCKCRDQHFGEFCQYADGRGTRFLLIFHQGCKRTCWPRYNKPELLVASNIKAHLSVRLFSGNQINSVYINKTNPTSDLDQNVIPLIDGISTAGAEISSDVKVRVYGFIFQKNNKVSEGFLVLPTRYLSTRYVIPMYTTTSHSAVIAISPLYSNTNITIQLRFQSGPVHYNGTTYYNDDLIRITLDKYSTFQLKHSYDLSGTLVTSSREIAVMSGSTCNNVYTNVTGASCQPFMEMVLPMNQLDRHYIIPYIAERKDSIVRIQAVGDPMITISSNNTVVLKFRIDRRRDHYDFHHSQGSSILSSEDILVMIYPVERPDGKGDSFMMTIHGVNQYLSEYDFVVPENFTSFISVTVPHGSADGFIIDGKSATNYTTYRVDNFDTFSLSISSGAHHIEHNKHLRFGLWVYGNSNIDSYGYPAGIAFK